jgi:hypothetical protein
MPRAVLNLLFAITIFIGAFLLFQVQPLIGKYILPWFGGSPAVWTACMLFFQVMLLVGYAYAHASIRYLRSPNVQMIVHLLLLTAAVAMLPIVPGAKWVPTNPDQPTARIVAMLLACVGVPYVALAATGPLLQGWYARMAPGRSPYRLYALSNVASMLALISYPILVEPALSRPVQARVWGYLLIAFAVLCAGIAILQSRSPAPATDEHSPETLASGQKRHWILWLLLPACASVLLLAVTNKICQDVAVIPLLWVLPLAIYLLSFIICFDSPRWYTRGVFIPLMWLALAGVCWAMFQTDEKLPILPQISVYLLALFACCMVCHGELYRLRPVASRLTSFYLMIALGGAIGGILVALVAPRVFKGYFELHLGLFATALLTVLILRPSLRGRLGPLFAGMCIALLGVTLALLINATSVLKDATVVARSRNFYGVLSVFDVNRDEPLLRCIVLQHGGVTHGLQFVDPQLHNIPTAYFGPQSGVGVMFRNVPRPAPLRVGVVGLGIGTVAAYAQPGDVFRFYEINPNVLPLAVTYFDFLNRSPARIEHIDGDARLSMQQEPQQNYDVFILDAFSGDAIPVHLLTRECFELYLHHLREGGIIAVHISNQHLNLAPVVRKLADHFGLASALIVNSTPAPGQYVSRWMLLSRNERWIGSPAIQQRATPLPSDQSGLRLWTDDDTNLFQILN